VVKKLYKGGLKTFLSIKKVEVIESGEDKAQGN